MALVRAAAERSCTIVLTHADNPADCYSLEQQEEAAALGAYVEHCFFTTFHGRTPIGEIARQIRAVPPSICFGSVILLAESYCASR